MKASAEAVLRLLRSRPDGVTRLETIYARCGSNLPARVLELKSAGYDVRDEWETTEAGARIKRYRLVEHRAPMTGTQTQAF